MKQCNTIKNNSYFTALAKLVALSVFLSLSNPMGLGGAEHAFAACASGRVAIAMPAPQDSQIFRLFETLSPFWKAKFRGALEPLPVPGRGGSYAISTVIEKKQEPCALAAVNVPGIFLLSASHDSMFSAENIRIPSIFAFSPNTLWVDEASTFITVGDFITHAREEAAKGVSFAFIAGVGSLTDQHLATLQLNRAAGIATSYLPMLGSAEAAKAVKDGMASACWGYALPPDSMPGLRPLAVAGETRSPALPNTPTFTEEKVLFTNIAYFGLAMNATASEASLAEISAAANLLLADETLRASLAANGFLPFSLHPADAPAFLAAQRQKALENIKDYDLLPIF